MRIETTFGILVRNRRKTLGLTQGELAQQVGCSTVTIRKIEADERRPSPHMAERLARFLEIAAEEQEAFLRAARVEEPLVALDVAHNLPAKLPHLVGREALLAAARNRLQRSETRLLTLTGTGGVGKTSLALQLAVDSTHVFRDGVFVVVLDRVEDAERVLPAIAATLDAPGSAQQSAAERVRLHIGARRVLLLLDNMEHVLGAGSALVALLDACPALTLLVTSRVALRISGEQTLAVPPLETPPASPALDVSTLLRYPAAELFVRHARAARHDFHPTNNNASSISAICTRMDGLPLAIELVAARSNVLEPAELAQRLAGEHGYAPLGLARSAAHVSPRLRTLHGAIDWSFHLLERREQGMLLQLGAFVGGFDLRGAEAVCGAPNVAPIDVLEGLQTLIEAHLLVRQSVDDETRFAMLQTIREYAVEALAAQGLAAETSARHAQHFEAFAVEADAHIEGPKQTLWVNRIEREHDNLRAALRWSLGASLPVAVQLGCRLWWFWLLHGDWREGLGWLSAVLQRAEATNASIADSDRAELCKGAATLAKELTEYATADTYYQQALKLYKMLDQPRGCASTLNNYAGMLHRQGRIEAAIAYYQEAAHYVHMLGATAHEGLVFENLAVIYQEQNEPDLAQTYHERAWEILRDQHDLRLKANALTNFGQFGLFRGDLAAAAERYAEAVALYEAAEEQSGLSHALNGLGLVAYCQGEYARSMDLQRQALHLSEHIGDNVGIVQALEGYAHALGATGVLNAATYYGAAEAQRATLSIPLPLTYSDLYHAAQTKAAQHHTARAWTAMLLRGRIVPFNTVVANAQT